MYEEAAPTLPRPAPYYVGASRDGARAQLPAGQVTIYARTEGVEPYGDNQWDIIEPSEPAERLAANTFQMRVRVPAGGKTTVTYTVETK